MIGAGIYPSPPRDCAYILDHSDAVAVLVENDEQRAKIDAERASLPKLRHVFSFDDLDDLRAKGREFAAENPDALELAGPRWARKTSSPTSTRRGRPGRPRPA